MFDLNLLLLIWFYQKIFYKDTLIFNFRISLLGWRLLHVLRETRSLLAGISFVVYHFKFIITNNNT